MNIRQTGFMALLIFPLLVGSALAAVPREQKPAAFGYPTDGIMVSPQGDDRTGTGSLAKPYRTIQHVLDAVLDSRRGGTILLRGGTYAVSTEVRLRYGKVKIAAWQGEKPVIKAPIDKGDDCVSAFYFDPEASDCLLAGLEIIGGSYYCIMFQTNWDWDETVAYRDRYGASRTTIVDCRIHGSGRDCIKLTEKCDDITIRNCEIYGSGASYAKNTPFDDKNAEGIDNVGADRLLVEDCWIHDIATTGIYCKGGATDCLVQRCTIERCGFAGAMLGFDTSPEYFDLGENPQWYENIRGIVRNCLIRDTDYEGIGFYASRDGIASHNTLVNTGSVGHAAIWFGISYQDWDEKAGRPASTGALVAANLVVRTMPLKTATIGIRYADDFNGISALSGWPVLRNNVYDIAGGGRFEDSRPGTELDMVGLAAWAAKSGDNSSEARIPLKTDGSPDGGAKLKPVPTEGGAGFYRDGSPRASASEPGALRQQ